MHFELLVSWWLDLLARRSNGTSRFDRARLLTIALLEPGLNASPDLCYCNTNGRPLMTLTSFLKHLFARVASPASHHSSGTCIKQCRQLLVDTAR